jgi:hypothetical protein
MHMKMSRVGNPLTRIQQGCLESLSARLCSKVPSYLGAYPRNSDAEGSTLASHVFVQWACPEVGSLQRWTSTSVFRDNFPAPNKPVLGGVGCFGNICACVEFAPAGW